MRNLILLLVGLVFVGGIGLLIWYFVGGEEVEETGEGHEGADTLMITASEGAKDPFATTTEEYKSTARKSRMIALKESLERSLDSREGTATASAKDRMAMPWFMLVGADGSGKKTILANTGLPLPWGPPLEVDSQRKDAGKWWLFDQAVVLEAPAAAPGTTPGTQTLPPGQTVSDTSVGWNTLLHMLRRERPDSPLNGIIVTISCADLMGARVTPERMEEQADRIRNFLERTRKFLGVRLPLHVLVTKCDTLPGFRSFAEALPESRRHDIFGWANPNALESRFEPAWVDNGFTHLQQELQVLRDEVLAAPEQVRDSVGVFVFDSEFSDLQEPLKALVARLMTIGERRPSLFFRGFYFTGDSLDATPPADADTTLSEGSPGGPRQTTRISAEIAGEAHNLVFLRSLFSEKIFKEAGLARSAARLRLARDRRVVIAQAAAIIIALGGGAGLWTAVNGYGRDNQVYRAGLKADAAALTRVLSGVAIDLDELRRGAAGGDTVLERRTRDAAVIELVGQMRDVPSMRVRSPFIPTSWFSPLPNEIRASMMAGVQNIVLPVTRQRLQERAQRLLQPRTAANSMSSDELDPSDPRSLTTYLSDVRALSRNIARYNSLASPRTGSVSDLSELLDYLFGERIASDSNLDTPDFDEALNLAAGQSIAISPDMVGAVMQRSIAMVASVAANASRQLAPRTTPAAERAVKPEEDLQALHGLAALVDLIDPKRGVVASVSNDAILGMRLARAVEDSIKAQLTLAAVRIAKDTLAPEDAANRLRTVIGNLYQFRLMERAQNRLIANEIRPNERLRWDVGRLELALALRGEFLQAVVAIQDAFPGQPPDRMRRALEVQMRFRAIDVASSAQRFTPLDSPAVDPFVEVRAQSANLETAAPRLARLAVLLDTLKAPAEGRRLIVAGTRQAEHALAMAQAIFERQRYLAPQTAKVVAWQGVIPIGFAALGVTDSLGFGSQLLAHETAVRTLAHDVAPSLRYLRRPEVGDSLRLGRLLGEWEAIATAVAKYERGDAASTMGMLHRYVREGMAMSDPAACTAAAAETDTIKPSTDIFVIRRRQFRAALVARCGVGGSAEAVAAYQKLRTQFQTRLANRYPFVDTSATRAPEADPSMVRDFFRQYDAFALTGDVALRSDPALAQTGKPVAAFLDQLEQVRAFMAPHADAGAAHNVPEYSLMIGRGTATLSDSVAALLQLHVGARELTIDDSEHDESWRYGDSVTVVLTPLDTSKARPMFAARGGWALLRFAQQPRGLARVRFYHPDTKVGLVLPAFPTSAPELVVPRTR